MTHLSDLMPLNVLRERIREGYVRLRRHPADEELMILNYSEKAQYERVWDEVTTQCRGLIIQADPNPYLGVFDGALVVARPWSKFFNLGEHEPGIFAPEAWVSVQDKMDGSLGILYCAPDGDWAIATRGSFESEQAAHATDLYRRQYEDYWAPRPGFTYLFEIIYPENRIVLDYDGRDDLVLLDIIETATGQSVLAAKPLQDALTHGWPGDVAERVITDATLAQAMALPPRANAEGLVVTFIRSGLKVKIKQEDYVALHKIVTGLNERVVWEHLAAGKFDDLGHAVPDEFHEWLTETATRLWDAHDELQGRAHAAFHNIEPWKCEPEYRKAFAETAKQHGDLTPLLFQMLDGRDISPAIWKTLRPRGDSQSLLNRNEDNS